MQKWMKYIHGVMQQPLVDVTSAIVENCSKLKFSGQWDFSTSTKKVA